MAWLDVPGGAYCYVLFNLVERGKRPLPGTESMYETTTQVVRVLLSPPMAEALRRIAARQVGDWCSVANLLGDVSHGPYDVLAGQGAYRVTCSRIQASLPALLLQQGQFRWAVSLATSSPFVVSRGRPAYGTCRQRAINEVVGLTHDLLAWPRSPFPDERTLVGSFTTPRAMALIMTFAALAAEADSLTLPADNVDDVVACLNAHAAYLAMLLALVYALRGRVVYPLPTRDLRAGRPLKFDDKDEHSMPGRADTAAG